MNRLFSLYLGMKFISIVIISLFSTVLLQAQELDELYEDRLDSLIDRVLFEDEELAALLGMTGNYQFIYGRVSFENKSFYAGRSYEVEQYNITGQLAYFHSSGIQLGVAGIKYEGMDPSYVATVGSLGYSFKPWKQKNLRLRASYDHYFYTNSDSVSAKLLQHNLNAGITYRYKKLGSRIDYSLLFGEGSASQITFDLFGDFTLFSSGWKNKLSFEPEISFFVGSEESVRLELIMSTGPFGRPKPTYEWIEDSRFGWMNTSIQFPFTFNLGNLDLEAAYTVNVPRSLYPDQSFEPNGFFSFSVGYIVGW